LAAAPALHNQCAVLQRGRCVDCFRGQTLHIWKSRLWGGTAPHPPARRAGKPEAAVVSCGSGALELVEVQLEGRNAFRGDFANGSD